MLNTLNYQTKGNLIRLRFFMGKSHGKCESFSAKASDASNDRKGRSYKVVGKSADSLFVNLQYERVILSESNPLRIYSPFT